MIVLDEHGFRWEVSKGDPAYAAADHLKRRGYADIVLPRTLLVHGRRVEGLPWPSDQGAVALTNDVRNGAAEPDNALRYMACLDCCREIISLIQ